jgi:hypothetical protein
MFKYTHVIAINDVYNHRGDIICFAGEKYEIIHIDTENELYAVDCEPEIGGYPRAIGVADDDEDFRFIMEAK